jgi:pyruvate kinase
MSLTKIVATIGPKSAAPEILRQLREAGMDVARLNGSHNSLDWHAATIRLLREVVPDVPILLDIPGRKIRTGQLAVEPQFAAGGRLVLTTDPAHDGSEKVPVGSADLHEKLRIGDAILADDGTLRFTVMALEGRDIVCRAETAGTLRSRKGINVPQVKLSGALVTDRDRHMLAFAKTHGVDFVGISFVGSAEHVEAIRAELGAGGPKIVSKVENQEGLDHLAEIVTATDVIMIDRGDLSVETSLEDLAIFQKEILLAAKGEAKPTIVATEMLHSMVVNPFPTKAEISDISNAVLDFCSATMLSGETAVGEYPVEAVALMRRVSVTAVRHMQSMRDREHRDRTLSVPQAMSQAIGFICRSLPVTKIVAVTKSGYAAGMIAADLPRQPILAVSNDPAVARRMNILAGTTGVHVDIPFARASNDHIMACVRELWRRRLLTDDDIILVTAVTFPKSGNRMNLIQTHAVSDLVETLAWKR